MFFYLFVEKTSANMMYNFGFCNYLPFLENILIVMYGILMTLLRNVCLKKCYRYCF